MQHLPPGHTLAGAGLPALGGVLYRVRRDSDGCELVARSAESAYPGDAAVQHLDAEFGASLREGIRGLPRPSQRIDGQRLSWLLYEDVAGHPLETSGPYELDDFWEIAEAATSALAEAHRCGRTHGRLQSSCIWWDPLARRVALLGMVSADDAQLANQLPPTEDTAPELIATQGAKVTATADIYSLGAIFYRLLTGRPAVTPSANLAFDAAANPPARLDPAHVPEALGELVTRMLSKAPSWRPIDASVVLAELRAARFGARLPSIRPAQSFVGRALDLEALLEQMRAADGVAATVVRLAGEPGIGKSTLLGQLVRTMSGLRRIVADGKCEQFRQGRPYSALLSACANALSHVLAGDEPALQRMRQRLREADAALLAVLRPEIPELEHLCGPLPDVLHTGPSENEHRFKRAFAELLASLCTEQTRLVLVLDDVQWADRATADLLAELFEAGLPDHLVLVLAYRDRAAEQNADLAKLFRVLAATPMVRLGPFDLTGTEALCAELVPGCDGASALASAIHHRSQGNPLHAAELVRNLMDNSEIHRERGRWVYRDTGHALQDLSETVVALIRDRLGREPTETRRLLTAAACAGHRFSKATLSVALGEESSALSSSLASAVRSGFLVTSSSEDEYAFCHDRVQQISFELGDEVGHGAVYLRLGRHYRDRITRDRAALFPCLECLNRVEAALDEGERHALTLLNLEGARRARASIAYERAIKLLRCYLASPRISSEARFEATLLLTECVFLLEARESSSGGIAALSASELAIDSCAELVTTEAQELELLHRRLLFNAHRQRYAAGVEVGLRALRSLGQGLPEKPGMLRALGSVVALWWRLRHVTPTELTRRSGRTSQQDLDTYRFLVGLWGCAWWANPLLAVLTAIRLVEFTLRCGNGPHASMACISHAIILHMLGQRARAVSYARAAEDLAQSPYCRAYVRFARLTFLGVLERSPGQVLQKYDEALKECVAHGESIASHLIDGAVTTLPHWGPELPLVAEALVRYEREARALGATPSLEMIELVRSWRGLLLTGLVDAETGKPRASVLYEPVVHESYSGSRDLLCMQIEYLAGRDEEVLARGRAVEKHGVFKANPLHRASHAVFVILASTRRYARLTRAARVGLTFLQRLDAFVLEGETSPGTFLPALRLAQGVQAVAAGDSGAVALLEEAASLARAKGQRLLLAICLERLARLHGQHGNYGACAERIRDAAHAFRRFGALAMADALVREFPAVDWTLLRPSAPSGVTMQVEGIMRSATAIVEATSTDELGPTLLRVIATTAGAMRAFLFSVVEGELMLVAGCERDRANLLMNPTPLAQLDPLHYALKPVHRVGRSSELVELPRDRAKFLDDPYLLGPAAPLAMLCVPLLYRGELVAVLYLENSSNGETFSQEEVGLVTLLGKQAAIAMTNADNHRLQIEALQSKVNPHFLHNALSVVAELAGRAPEQAEEAAFKLNRLYRAMVTSHAELCVSLEKELALVHDYLELERARFGNKLRVSWEIDDAAKSCGVPALLVQPLAENAVNHGVRRKAGGSGAVRISARRRGDVVLICVSDDGPGWYEGQGGTGFGLKSVRRRLQLVYGNRAQLRIVKGDGVAVEITIPAQEPTYVQERSR